LRAPDDKSALPEQVGFLRFRPLHVDLGDVLVQIVAVALGVIVGFAVTSWNERVHQRALLRDTISNIVAEIRSNQSGLHEVMREHARGTVTFTAFLAQSRDSMSLSRNQAKQAIRYAGHFRENIPLSIAWQIAQSDQGLALLPYQDRYDLAWIYQVQNVYYQAEERFKSSLLTVTEPPNNNYYFLILDLDNQEQSVVVVLTRSRGHFPFYGEGVRNGQASWKLRAGVPA